MQVRLTYAGDRAGGVEIAILGGAEPAGMRSSWDRARLRHGTPLSAQTHIGRKAARDTARKGTS